MGFFTGYPCEGGHSGGSGHLILPMGLVLILFTVFQTSAPHCLWLAFQHVQAPGDQTSMARTSVDKAPMLALSFA